MSDAIGLVSERPERGEEDVLIFAQEGVSVQLPSWPEPGVGTMSIYESDLVWWSDALNQGFILQYPNIGLHAVQRELSSIYMQVCASDDAFEELNFIAPEEALEGIFVAISHAQSLHPDPEDADSEEEGEDGEDLIGEDGPKSKVGHYDAVFQMPTQEEMERMMAEGTYEVEEEEDGAEGVEGGEEEAGMYEDVDQ